MQFYEEHHALRRFYFASAARCASAFLRFDEVLHRATATFIAKASARAFTATKPTHTAGARASPLPCAPLWVPRDHLRKKHAH